MKYIRQPKRHIVLDDFEWRALVSRSVRLRLPARRPADDRGGRAFREINHIANSGEELIPAAFYIEFFI